MIKMKLQIGLLIKLWLANLALLQVSSGIVATPVSLDQNADDPYRWTGLVEVEKSGGGFRGSGSVIKHPNLVVSCAHLVFDGDIGRWIGGSDSTWTRAHFGDGRPSADQRIPLAGFWRWQSYQDSWFEDRSRNVPADKSSPVTFSRDFIAFWSYEFTAAGGHGGYYTGDTRALLRSSAWKMITGYPAFPNGSTSRSWNMWKTGPFFQSFTAAQGRYMVCNVGGTSGGNSGGPVWTQSSNGKWYQAGVLVSSGPGVVAFDQAAQELLNAAIESMLPDEPRLEITGPDGIELHSSWHAFEFGETPVGSSQRRNLTFSNRGTGDLVITQSGFQWGENEFSFEIPATLRIPEGGQVVFPVEFSPSGPGVRSAMYYIESNDTRYNQRTLDGGVINRFNLNVRGHGVAVPGDFEELQVGGRLAGRLSVGGEEKIYWVRVNEPGHFEFKTESAIDTVGELLTVEGDRIGWGDDTVRFIAGKHGPHGNDFLIRQELSVGNYLLVVRGYDGSVKGDFVVTSRLRSESILIREGQRTLFDGEVMARLELPRTDVGSELVLQLEIENTGEVAVQVADPQIRGAAALEFQVGPVNRTNINSGRKVYFDLVFRPSRTGIADARIEIVEAGPEGHLMAVVNVRGEANSNILTFEAYSAAAGLLSSNALPKAEPFGDGVSNLLKYAFNMDATGPDVSTLVPGTGTSGLPVFALGEVDGESVIQVEFVRRKNSGLIYAPKWSSDLQRFEPMGGTEKVELIDDEWERVIVSEPCDPAVTPRCFGVVEVVLPE